MYLQIDTSQTDCIKLAVLNSDNSLVKSLDIRSNKNQAEILLTNIDKLLKKSGINLKNLTKIIVKNKGKSYTSLRIGVLTANALAYALNIKVEQAGDDNSFLVKHKKYQVVLPDYDSRL